ATSGSMPTTPAGSQGQQWSPNTASTSAKSIAPDSRIARAPLSSPNGISSAGWSRTVSVPAQSDTAASLSAAVTTTAMWTSCPQACITPGVVDRYSTSFASVRGSASRSARITTAGPAPRASLATTPVLATPVVTSYPAFRNRALSSSAVRCSANRSSGRLWISRRSSTALRHQSGSSSGGGSSGATEDDDANWLSVTSHRRHWAAQDPTPSGEEESGQLGDRLGGDQPGHQLVADFGSAGAIHGFSDGTPVQRCVYLARNPAPRLSHPGPGTSPRGSSPSRGPLPWKLRRAPSRSVAARRPDCWSAPVSRPVGASGEGRSVPPER